MACALCLVNTQLRLSHIVPEFMYRQMYDVKHRFFAMTAMSSERVRLHQKGLREELLCDQCEQRFCRYEAYAASVFNGNAAQGLSGRRGIVLQSLDYERLKLFFLSLLWRFGVTNLKGLRGTRLGPHAERIRKMLLADDPGAADKYPCFVTAVTCDGKHVSDLIVSPCPGKFEGHHVWSFVVAGILLTFFVSNHSPAFAPKAAFLQENGSLVISVKEITSIDFLFRFACEIAEAQERRAGRKR